MNYFEAFFSAELDPYSSNAWFEIAPVYRSYLSNLAKKAGLLSVSCGLSYIPTIYRDFEGVKPRLYFSKKDRFIDYRPLIPADQFAALSVQERMHMLTSLLPKVTLKTHLIGLQDEERQRLDRVFKSPLESLCL